MNQTTDSKDASSIASRGWLQGAVLPEDMVLEEESIGTILADMPHIPPKPIGIIISQSCDVVCDNFEKEPFVEILFGTIIDENKFDPAFSSCKNPRRLHLQIPNEDNSQRYYADFSVHDRVRIKRELLCDYAPNESLKLSDSNVKEIRRWIVQRYDRTALPHSFNDRIKERRKKIRNLLKKEPSSYLSSIFLRLYPDKELQPDEPYELIIIGCMQTEDYDTPQKRTDAHDLVDKLAAEIDIGDETTTASSENAIYVKEALCVSEKTLSLHAVRYMKRWCAYDDITIREDATDKIPRSE